MTYLSGMLCDIRHNRRKVESPAGGVHKKLAGATTDLLPRISLGELFLRKIRGHGAVKARDSGSRCCRSL